MFRVESRHDNVTPEYHAIDTM